MSLLVITLLSELSEDTVLGLILELSQPESDLFSFKCSIASLNPFIDGFLSLAEEIQ